MSILGVIPVRYNATRLPGKPLISIQGKPMVQHVYERSSQSKTLERIVIATDDQRISDVAKGFGADVLMTRSDHKNGTERVAEVANKLSQYDHVINIQGDEPLIDAKHIDQVASLLQNDSEIATLIRKVDDEWVLDNPSEIKVVVDQQLKALYFSRSAIPYIEKQDRLAHHTFFHHIGIYGFKLEILKRLVKLNISALEKSESLEQLRWLENGYTIHTGITDIASRMIDTPEDLENLIKDLTHG